MTPRGQATKDAGRIAGLNVLRIINEPTSAALAYGLDHGAPQKIMVYDLGGGTFDVSLIEIGDNLIEVLATAGDNRLGGDDFDARLTEYIVQEYIRTNRINLAKDPVAMQRIREAAEEAKKALSSQSVTNINLPFVATVKGDPVHLEMEITRSKFDELTRDLVDRTEAPVRKVLMTEASAFPNWEWCCWWAVPPEYRQSRRRCAAYREKSLPTA